MTETETLAPPSTELTIPPHLSDSARDGTMKTAQLRAGGEIMPVIPGTLEEAFRYAVAVCGAGLAPDSYRIGGTGKDRDDPDPQKVLIGILKALEVGYPPITGLSVIAIINNRPCIWGDGAIGLVQSRGLVDKVETFFEGTPERVVLPTSGPGVEVDHTPTLADFTDQLSCVYRIWRRGQPIPYEGRFSVRDAKRAHLWGNPKKVPWMLYPRRMLFNRARAFALRDGFADALAGLGIREEVEDMLPEPPATDASFLDDAPAAATAQAAIAAPSEVEVAMAMPPTDLRQPAPVPLDNTVDAPSGVADAPGTAEAAPPAAQGSPAAAGEGALPADTVDPPADPPTVRKFAEFFAGKDYTVHLPLDPKERPVWSLWDRHVREVDGATLTLKEHGKIIMDNGATLERYERADPAGEKALVAFFKATHKRLT